MESLPTEIILDIFSRLPISSLVQCKFVCRSWCNLAHDRWLANMHLSRSGENDPCLILHFEMSAHPIQNQLCFLDIDSHGGYQEKAKEFNIPFRSEMLEFDVVGSCNGLLCLSNSLLGNPHTTYIYNPFTREYKELPQASLSQNQLVAFGFGFHPITKEYKVVRIVHHKSQTYGLRRRGLGCPGYKQMEFQIFTLGTHAWRDIGRAPYQLTTRQYKPVLVNGSLHWLTEPFRKQSDRGFYRSIISFDLASEQFHEVPRPQCGSLEKPNYYLVALKGNLSAVVYGQNVDLEIWGMRDYNVSESWTKEVTIRRDYVPVGLEQRNNLPMRYARDWSSRYGFRVVCTMKNGDILLDFKGIALFSYHPDREEFKELKFHGPPQWFQAVTHVGSFISMDHG